MNANTAETGRICTSVIFRSRFAFIPSLASFNKWFAFNFDNHVYSSWFFFSTIIQSMVWKLVVSNASRWRTNDTNYQCDLIGTQLTYHMECFSFWIDAWNRSVATKHKKWKEGMKPKRPETSAAKVDWLWNACFSALLSVRNKVFNIVFNITIII